MLEELHFSWDELTEGDKLYLTNNSNWNLLKLKTLVYHCFKPSKGTDKSITLKKL